MNRLNKELRARGIVYDAPDVPSRIEYDAECKLVSIDKNFIICVYTSAVLEPQFQIYDLHFNPVAVQDRYKDTNPSFGPYHNPWGSFFIDDDDVE